VRAPLDKWLSLHVRKKLLNLAIRFLDALLPDPRPQYPQTRLLEDVYKLMDGVFRVEVLCGRFDDVPWQKVKTLKDRHFLKVLELSRKGLICLADTDRYYRQWLGLFFLLVHDAVEKQREKLDYENFLVSVLAQWDFDMRGAFPKKYFDGHRKEFQEIMLANNLANLCAKRYQTLVSREAEQSLNRGEKLR